MDEDRLIWRCREVTGDGDLRTLRPDLIPADWKAQIYESWPRAVSIGYWDTAQPWVERLGSRDSFSLQHSSAQWIWTADYGNDGYDGYRNVFCSVELPATCGGANQTAPTQCSATSTPVEQDNLEYCVEYVSAPSNLGLTWVEADAAARAQQAKLLPVLNAALQEAAVREMIDSGASNAWIAGRANYSYPPGPWRWLDACCGLDPLVLPAYPDEDPYAFRDQGCFHDNFSAGQPAYTETSTSMTVQFCRTLCDGYMYAGIKNGNTCVCGDELASRRAAVSDDLCSSTCSGGGGNCGGATTVSVYTVHGIHTLDWQTSDQPNNHNGVDYCAALRFPTGNNGLQAGALADERCREQYLSLCELPAGSGCGSGSSLYFSHTDGRYQRCFMVNLQSELSWYQARQACRASGGDLASLFTAPVATAVEGWLRALMSGSVLPANSRLWVGAHREAWFWSFDPLDPVDFTQWADGEPATKDNANDPYEWECLYISREGDYGWKAGRCDDQTGGNRFGYIKVVEKMTATPPTTDNTAAPPTAAKTKSNTNDGLSTFETVLIVVLVIIALILLILFIAFICYKKYNGNRLSPSKYDARPIAPVPTAGYLGDEETAYVISENDSTADLISGPGFLEYGSPMDSRKSALSGKDARINITD